MCIHYYQYAITITRLLLSDLIINEQNESVNIRVAIVSVRGRTIRSLFYQYSQLEILIFNICQMLDYTTELRKGRKNVAREKMTTKGGRTVEKSKSDGMLLI